MAREERKRDGEAPMCRFAVVLHVPAMSLSGADETREFASRITYEAREDLAKESRSQLPRAISMEDDNDEYRAARTCTR